MSEKVNKKRSISVETLYLENKKKLKLKLISDDSSFKKQFSEKNLHRPGLALAGFVDLFSHRSYLDYLEEKEDSTRKTHRVVCIILQYRKIRKRIPQG